MCLDFDFRIFFFLGSTFWSQFYNKCVNLYLMILVMIHFDHIVTKMWWKCWRWKKIIWRDNNFSSLFYYFVKTTKQDEMNGKLLFCRPLHFMKMCQCIWYLFFGPLHLKIPAPKNQQWRISFGDSDVFSFGIFGLNM